MKKIEKYFFCQLLVIFMSVKMDEMSWVDIEDAIEDGNDTVLIMLGSIEQHGPHLPLGTDTYISDALGEKIAEKLGDALLAPTIRPGVSAHHMDFPGTISISPRLLMDLVEEYCEALDKHEFEYIVLIPFHGGNFDPVKTAAPEIARDMENANLITIADLEKQLVLMNEAMKDAGIDYEEPVIHSGASETSVMLSIKEKLVNKDKMEKGHEGPVPVSLLFSKGLRYFTENGVLGNPTKGNSKAGEFILESLGDNISGQIKEEREKIE